MRKAVWIVTLLAASALSACGQRADLSLGAGKEMPPAPYGRSARPTSSELLEPPSIAIPERNVELRTRSEEREDDPFDLPPPEE